MRAHARGVAACRAEGRHAIGIAVNLEPKYPASERPEDREATRRAHAYRNRQYLDPLFFGTHPAPLADILGPAWPVRARSVRQPGATYTETGWEVYPQGLADTLAWLRRRYGAVPLYIAENGAAFQDPPTARGELGDPLRVAYYRDHLRVVHEALGQGLDLRGYFAWSLLDNFEWSHGYARRFGIVHVDYATQKRAPKASARCYARVIRSRGRRSSSSPAADAAPAHSAA